MRCTSTGRKCDGYFPIDKSVPVETGLKTPPPPLTLVVSPSTNSLGEYQELRSLHYFKIRTGPQLSGFFRCQFWDRLLLQAIHHEPSLRHAVIATGSLHERFEAGDTSILRPNEDIDQGGLALKQYNMAIRSLVRPGPESKPALDVCLTACILFTSFEVRL